MDACISEGSLLWSLHVHCPQMAEFPHILVQAVEESAACYCVCNLQRNLLWTVCNIRVTPVQVATFPSQRSLGVFPHFSSIVLEVQSLESGEPETTQPWRLNSCVVGIPDKWGPPWHLITTTRRCDRPSFYEPDDSDWFLSHCPLDDQGHPAPSTSPREPFGTLPSLRTKSQNPRCRKKRVAEAGGISYKPMKLADRARGRTMRKVLFLLLFVPGVLLAREPQEAGRNATFYRQFSAANKPVLTIDPGDSVHTTTVDAGGTDEKGVTRVLGGNPETGPFYVETAAPGDTLVVRLTRVRLNRDWAQSDDFIMGRALDGDLAVKMKDAGKTVRWHLDAEHRVAMPEKPAEHLTRYSVPLRSMLGCVAVAPNAAQAAPGT